jgi:hypothetical protein
MISHIPIYRLEQSIDNIERMRESTSKRYRDLQIPCEWMLDTGLIGKVGSTQLIIFTPELKVQDKTTAYQ